MKMTNSKDNHMRGELSVTFRISSREIVSMLGLWYSHTSALEDDPKRPSRAAFETYMRKEFKEQGYHIVYTWQEHDWNYTTCLRWAQEHITKIYPDFANYRSQWEQSEEDM